MLESEAINRRVGSARPVQGRMLAAFGQLQNSRRIESPAAVERRRARAGVVAFSSGNHAQAVALAARWLDDAGDDRHAGRCAEGQARSNARISAPRSCSTTASERIARRSRRASPSNAAPRSCRRSIIRTSSRGRARSRSSSAERLARAISTSRRCMCPCSGGGLVAGCALAIKAEWPALRRVRRRAARLRGHGGVARCRRAPAVSPGGTTLCDGLRAPTAGRDHVRDQSPRARGRARRRRRADSRTRWPSRRSI